MKSVDSTEAAFPSKPATPVAPAAAAQASQPAKPPTVGPGGSMNPDATPAWMVNPYTGKPYTTAAGIATAKMRAKPILARGGTPTAQQVNPQGVAASQRLTNPAAYGKFMGQQRQKIAATDPTLEQLKIEFWSQPAEKVAAAIAIYPRLEKQAIGMPDLSQLKELANQFWSNPQYEGIRNALLGAGVGGGLGLASATMQPEEHRDYGNRMLTGAAIGGLGGLGYTYLPKALAGIQDATASEPHLGRMEADLKRRFEAQGATTPGTGPPLMLSPEARAKLVQLGDQLASDPNGPTGNLETFGHHVWDHPLQTFGLMGPGALGGGALGVYAGGAAHTGLDKILDRLSPSRLRNSLTDLAENKNWSMVGEALGVGNLNPQDVLSEGIQRAPSLGKGKPAVPPSLIPRETPRPYARGLTAVQPAARPGAVAGGMTGHTAESLHEALTAHRARTRKLPGRLGALGAAAGAILGPAAEYYLGGGERRQAQEIRNRSGI